MTDSAEQQLAKIVDDAIGRRDPNLPRWATARVTRLLRELEPDERQDIIEKVCGRADVPVGVAADLRDAVQRSAGPAAAPSAPAPSPSPPAPTRTVRRASSAAPRSAPRSRGFQARTVRSRTLADVPHGTLVEYLGRVGVVEPPWLVLDDGRRFQFLNPAAVYVNGGVEVNGWDAWTVADGRSMAECHADGTWPPVEESPS
jgi:hypothetical protein